MERSWVKIDRIVYVHPLNDEKENQLSESIRKAIWIDTEIVEKVRGNPIFSEKVGCKQAPIFLK